MWHGLKLLEMQICIDFPIVVSGAETIVNGVGQDGKFSFYIVLVEMSLWV